MKITISTPSLLLPSIFLFFFSIASAQSYYVNDNSTLGDAYTSATGSDANAGTRSAPFATITKATTVATAGSIIYVDAGNYFDGGFTVPAGVKLYGLCPSSTIITLSNTINQVITLASNSEISRFKITRQTPTSNGGNTTIAVATITSGTNIKIHGCFFEKLRTAVYVNGTTANPGVTIENNDFNDNRTGIIFPDVNQANHVIKGNNIVNNRTFGVLFNNSGSVSNILVQNNNISGNLASQLEVNGSGNPNAITLTNNWFGSSSPTFSPFSVNGGFSVDDHNTGSTYPYNFTDNNGTSNPPNYPNFISGANSSAINFGSATYASSALPFSQPSCQVVQSNNPDANYFTIQEAINAANAGAVITVSNGTFNEDINLNKAVTVQGHSTAAIIRGLYNAAENTVLITASNAVLRNITVTRNYGTTVNDWYNTTKNQGINVGQATTGVTLQNLVVTGNRNGIYLNNAQNVLIENCTVEDNRTGIQLTNNISGTIIRNNFLRNNFTHGIVFNYDTPPRLQVTGVQVNNNSLTGNWYSQLNFQHNSATAYGDHTGLSVSCNWYGTANPKVVAANAAEPGYAGQVPSQFGGTDPGLDRQLYGTNIGLATYKPFLTDGTDSDLSSAGFQPVANSCNGPSSLYVNDNSTSGDVYTTAVGNNTNFGTKNSPYATIAYAMSVAKPGDFIYVDAGTYNEQVLVNKGVTIIGTDGGASIVDYTGTVTGKPTLFDISADAVTVDKMHFNVDLSRLRSAVIASAAGIDNIVVTNNIIGAYGTPAGSYGERNAVSINYAAYRVAASGVNSVTFTGNTVGGTGPSSYFRAAVAVDEAGGTFSGNTLQSINHDVQVRFGSNGNINITNNNFNGGGVELAEQNAAAGTLTVSGNAFEATFANSSAPGTAVLRLRNNQALRPTNINGNTFTNHQWAISLENYNTVTIDNNTFTPLAGSTTFRHITVNTKSISSNSSTIVQSAMGGVFTKNTFNGSGTLGGYALSFLNHDNDNASFGTFTIGTSGNENNFNANIANAIYLDGQTGTSSGSTFPNYTDLIGSGAGALTTMACWSTGIDARNNLFEGQAPATATLPQLFAIEDKIVHKIDNSCLGFVLVKTNNAYVTTSSFIAPATTTASVQRAINAASLGFTLNIADGLYAGDNTVSTTITIIGQSKTGTILRGNYTGKATLTLSANNIKIQDLTITRDYQDWYGSTKTEGVITENTSGVTLENLLVKDNRNGVYIHNCPGFVVKNCTISNNRTGMQIWGPLNNGQIVNNFITNNFTHGLLVNFDQGPTSAVNLLVSNNNISGNWYSQVNFQRANTTPAGNVGDLTGMNFNCNWYGTSFPAYSATPTTEPGYAAQAPSQLGGTDPNVNADIKGAEAARVTYIPYLTNGTDNDPASDGFQPVPGSCNGPIISTEYYVDDNSNTGDTYTPAGIGDDANPGTQAAPFRTIQHAIDVAKTGNTIYVDAGTYNEKVLVNTGVTIIGTDGGLSIVDYAGTVTGKPTLFDISADAVTVDKMHFNVDLARLRSAIIASAAGIDNIAVTNNTIAAYGAPTGSYGDRNAVSINYGGPTSYRVATGGVNNVTFTGNTVSGTPSGNFRSAVSADEVGGVFTNNTLQSINHDVLVRFPGNGNVTVSSNNFNGGGVELAEHNAGAGTISVLNNNFNGPFANTSAPGTAVLRIKNNQQMKPTFVSGNTFTDNNWAISIENYNNITVNSNTFTPPAGSTNYRHIVFNTKAITSVSNSTAQTISGGVFTNNTFDGSGTLGGYALSFLNHDNDNASFGTFTIGTAGNENNFNANIANAIYLDGQTGTSSGSTFPNYTDLIGSGAGALTTMACWSTGIDARNNLFEGQAPATATLPQLFAIEDKIVHKIDNSCLGFVLVKTNNDYVTTNSFIAPATTSAKIQRAVDAASNGFTVNVGPGSFLDNVVVNKEVRIAGQGAGLTTVYPALSNPVGSGGTLGGSNIFLVQANNVTIDNLTADGDNPGNGVGVDARNGVVTDFNSGDYTNLTVLHTTVQNIYWRGIYSAYGSTPGNTFNFHHNTVSNVQGDPDGSIGIFNFGNTGTIDNNTVSNTIDAIAANQSTGTMFTNNIVTGSGIHTDNNGGSGGIADEIRNNTVSNVGGGGYGVLVFLPSRNVIVDENVITNVAVAIGNIGQETAVTPVFSRNTIDGQSKANSTGIYQATSYPGFATSNVSGSYINNFIRNNQQGFYFKHEAGRTSTVEAHENSITGNSTTVVIAVGPDGAGTFSNNFSCNWYGGPAPTVVGGSLTYQPTLTNGTDADGDATNGFQPVAGSCNCESPAAQAYTSTTQTGSQSYGGELGMRFTVNNADGVVIKQLGAFDDGGNGITGLQSSGAIRVAIFNRSTQSIVTGLDVLISGTADAYTGNYRMKNISPVTLPPGDYVIVAKGYHAGERNGNTFSGSPIPVEDNGGGAITFGGAMYGTDLDQNHFNYPQQSDAYLYVAGTFSFATVIPCSGPTDANLSNLVLSQGTLTPTFTSGTKNYTATVANSVTSITVTPTAADAGATITVNGATVASGTPSGAIPLSEGNNIITTVVTAQDGTTTKTYTVNVTRASVMCESPAAQAYTSTTQTGSQSYGGELGMRFTVNNADGVVIKQLGAFDDGGNGITGLQSSGAIRVAIFNRSTQSIVTGLDVLISGTADAYTGNYRMKNISPVTLPPGDYVVVAKGYHAGERNGNTFSGSPIPVEDNGGGAITFGGAMYGTDLDQNHFNYPQQSDAYLYVAGTFSFATVIPCSGPTDANLSNLVLSQGTLTPTFTSGTKNYTATVANSVTSITVTPTAADAGATITVNGATVASGTPSGAIPLSEGNNIITTVVTAQDGTTTKTYTVNVTRASVMCESPAAQAYTSTTQTGSQSYGGELGMRFTVNNADGVVIKQLGAFDDGGNGITGLQSSGAIRVAIFNRSTQSIVTGLDVLISGTADAYTGNYRMKNISPVTLPPGDYVIVAKGYHAGERNGNTFSGSPIPVEDNGGGAITFGGAMYGADLDQNHFNYPQQSDAYLYVAGTFSFATVIPCSGPIVSSTSGTAIAPYVTKPQDPISVLSFRTDLKIYPNPSNGRFELVLSNIVARKVTIQILTETGIQVEQKIVELSGRTFSLTVPFDLNNKPSGMYFIKVTSEEGTQTKKIIIQR